MISTRLFIIALLFSATAFAQDVDDSLERDYAAELPRIAPTEPGDTLDTFQIVPGFQNGIGCRRTLGARSHRHGLR